jgi:hypothetical protein
MSPAVLAPLLAGLAAAILGGGTALAAPPLDCAILPTSALQTRPCNPRDECLRTIPGEARGPQLEARRRECSRLPASGVCHGPQTYNPQSECRERKRAR